MSWRTLYFILTLSACLPCISYANLNGYWQNFTNPAETAVRLTDIPSGYTTVIIAFADITSDGSVSFKLDGPPYSSMEDGLDAFKNDIKTLQSKKVKVLISLGGQNAYYSLNSSSQEINFVNSLEKLITDYQFDGVDYDFESGLTVSNNSYLVDATRRIKQDFSARKNIYFTAAPETLDVYWQQFPNGKYDSLITANLIDLVQTQLYNSGCIPSKKPSSPCYPQGSEDFIVSQADSTIQTWMANGIPDAAKRYVVGMPASFLAAGGGYLDPTIVKKALICLQTQTQCASYVPTQPYPELSTVMTWDINWDAKNNYAFAKAVTANEVK